MEVEVTIKQVFPAQEVTFKSGKSITKGGFLGETGGQYSKDILFQVIGKKCDILQDVQVGASVNVAFDLSSREYKGKYYTEVQAYSINQVGQSAVVSQTIPVGTPQPTSQAPIATQPMPMISEPQQEQSDSEALPF